MEIITEWKEFRAPDFDNIKAALKQRAGLKAGPGSCRAVACQRLAFAVK